MILNGLDCSHWQGVIDWNAVKTAKDFAFIKATGGDNGLYIDAEAYSNYRNAKNAGLSVGQYHFAGGTDPTEEAHYFITKISPLEENDVIILDWEVDHNDPVGWCKTFCDTVFQSTGVHPIIYMSLSRTTTYDWSSVAKDCGLWVAKYGINNGTLAGAGDFSSTGAFSCIAWQFTSKGTCPGISGNVDLDIFYGSLDQLKKYGWHAPVAEAPAPTPEPIPTTEPAPAEPPVEVLPVEPTPTPIPEENAPEAVPASVTPTPTTVSVPITEEKVTYYWESIIYNFIKGVIMSWLSGKKTYFVLAVAIISSIVGAWNGTITWLQCYEAILTACTAAGFRSAIK